MNKENYEWFKENGICTHCRHEKVVAGKTLCLECLMENRKYRSNRDKDRDAKSSKEKYEYRKQNGICVVCGKKPQQRGLKCNKCYSRIRMRKENNRQDITRSERPSYGYCYICGKEKLKDKNVCKDCYDTRLQSISKIMYMNVPDHWRNEENIRFLKIKAGKQ